MPRVSSFKVNDTLACSLGYLGHSDLLYVAKSKADSDKGEQLSFDQAIIKRLTYSLQQTLGGVELEDVEKAVKSIQWNLDKRSSLSLETEDGSSQAIGYSDVLAICGEVGTGKTLQSRRLVEQALAQGYAVTYINHYKPIPELEPIQFDFFANKQFHSIDFYEIISYSNGLEKAFPCLKESHCGPLNRKLSALLKQERMLVVIDEFEYMPDELLNMVIASNHPVIANAQFEHDLERVSSRITAIVNL
ncbi:ATP-binding protein [Vibrio agarivorans]|uniref:ATP-binding protein n=1 Tax=Vibrio agarivorans TaxID=153622 RepID=A0ABT7Y7P6_9VIBR|nr:ATP-binding protein [Vibrio agarivorans]MDN2484023.1 ATP-binding protein [Vibrio agarivorans]